MLALSVYSSCYRPLHRLSHSSAEEEYSKPWLRLQLKQSKEGEDGQLVKCKDTGAYLLLYIPIDHKELERYF